MKTFYNHLKKYNLLYAMSFEVWNVLEKLSEIPKIRDLHQIYRIQDSVERILDKYDGHLQPSFDDSKEEVRIATPCGCIYFNDCSECGSNSLCNTYN